MKYIFSVRSWLVTAVLDILILVLGILLWAILAPGVSVIEISEKHGEMIFRIIPEEFVHEFDAIVIWSIILFVCGFLLAWINFYFSALRSMKGFLFSIVIYIITACVVQNYGTALSYGWMKYQIDPLIKTFPPHTKMGLFYFLTHLSRQQLSIFNVGYFQFNVTTFTVQYAVIMAGLLGIALCFLIRTLCLPVPRLNPVIS